MSTHDLALSRLGELLFTGIDRTTLGDDTAAFLSQAGIGGVVLFSRNYASVEQLVELCNQIQECRADLPLWIAVDQEGGRVQRFKDPFTRIPPALEIAKTDSPKIAFELAQLMAKELKVCGINLNFAPSVDILTNPKNTVIGDRAYGTTEAQVTKMVSGIVRGFVVEGIQPCVKHFPGHGDTFEDSHDELPRVSVPLEKLYERELKPFSKTFKSRCNMVMVAHILNDLIDPDYPATLSTKTLQGILRKDMRFTKIIFSDDMEMKAITKFGPDKIPLLAVQAGCDVLVYRSESVARKAYESLRKALDEGELSPERVIESADRSREVKKEILLPFEAANSANAKSIVGCAEHLEFISKIK